MSNIFKTNDRKLRIVPSMLSDNYHKQRISINPISNKPKRNLAGDTAL